MTSGIVSTGKRRGRSVAYRQLW